MSTLDRPADNIIDLVPKHRYANAGDKQRVLAEFACYRSIRPPVLKNDSGGKGYPDIDILPFCDWLNSFEGICTLQSCAGHPPRKGHGASCGVLWVWLDHEFTNLFRLRVYDLVQNQLIERVSQTYSKWGEFVDIAFKGNESGHLTESLTALETFFRKLIDERGKLWV